MILEAFAEYLHNADPKIPADEVLAKWLFERLSSPPETNVDRVLHMEVSILRAPKAAKSLKRLREMTAGTNAAEAVSIYQSGGRSKEPAYVFRGASDSGKRLLKGLHEYCMSYDQQKWARFVHHLKASDFIQ